MSGHYKDAEGRGGRSRDHLSNGQALAPSPPPKLQGRGALCFNLSQAQGVGARDG